MTEGRYEERTVVQITLPVRAPWLRFHTIKTPLHVHYCVTLRIGNRVHSIQFAVQVRDE
jgi:hypothetical protein